MHDIVSDEDESAEESCVAMHAKRARHAAAPGDRSSTRIACDASRRIACGHRRKHVWWENRNSVRQERTQHARAAVDRNQDLEKRHQKESKRESYRVLFQNLSTS